MKQLFKTIIYTLVIAGISVEVNATCLEPTDKNNPSAPYYFPAIQTSDHIYLVLKSGCGDSFCNLNPDVPTPNGSDNTSGYLAFNKPPNTDDCALMNYLTNNVWFQKGKRTNIKYPNESPVIVDSKNNLKILKPLSYSESNSKYTIKFQHENNNNSEVVVQVDQDPYLLGLFKQINPDFKKGDNLNPLNNNIQIKEVNSTLVEDNGRKIFPITKKGDDSPTLYCKIESNKINHKLCFNKKSMEDNLSISAGDIKFLLKNLSSDESITIPAAEYNLLKYFSYQVDRNNADTQTNEYKKFTRKEIKISAQDVFDSNSELKLSKNHPVISNNPITHNKLLGNQSKEFTKYTPFPDSFNPIRNQSNSIEWIKKDNEIFAKNIKFTNPETDTNSDYYILYQNMPVNYIYNDGSYIATDNSKPNFLWFKTFLNIYSRSYRESGESYPTFEKNYTIYTQLRNNNNPYDFFVKSLELQSSEANENNSMKIITKVKYSKNPYEDYDNDFFTWAKSQLLSSQNDQQKLHSLPQSITNAIAQDLGKNKLNLGDWQMNIEGDADEFGHKCTEDDKTFCYLQEQSLIIKKNTRASQGD